MWCILYIRVVPYRISSQRNRHATVPIWQCCSCSHTSYADTPLYKRRWHCVYGWKYMARIRPLHIGKEALCRYSVPWTSGRYSYFCSLLKNHCRNHFDTPHGRGDCWSSAIYFKNASKVFHLLGLKFKYLLQPRKLSLSILINHEIT